MREDSLIARDRRERSRSRDARVQFRSKDVEKICPKQSSTAPQYLSVAGNIFPNDPWFSPLHQLECRLISDLRRSHELYISMHPGHPGRN